MITLPAETQLGAVHLSVSDLDRALGFYRDLLQFRVLARSGNRVFLSASGEPPFLMLLEAPAGARPKPPGTTGLYHIAIRYPDRPSLAVALGRLFERGWPLQGFADHGVSEAIYLPDADGLGVELYADRPRGSWPWAEGRLAMVTRPLAVDDLLRQREMGIEADPRRDMGHIHLQVGDLEAARVFYHQQMGFDITQQDYPGALFLSAGGYHHHIGLNTWAGQGAPLPPPDAVGLRAFSVVLPDRAAVEIRRAQLAEAGVGVGEEAWGWPTGDPVPVVQDPAGIKIYLSRGP